MEKLILDEARAEQNLVEPSIKSNMIYELGEELLKELRCLDPLEFITWRNSKFKDHKKVDETTKRALLHSWIEARNNEGIMDEDVSSDDDRDHINSSTITKPELKIGDEFLKILQDNSFNGMDRSDVTDHNTKVLEITEWIKISNVDNDELQLYVFSKSLSGDVEKWLNNKGTTTTWKILCDKFLYKYYPLSHTYKCKIPDDLDHAMDYFEFYIGWHQNLTTIGS
nr:hypothetical protein [Tanacetum cinerariifolium]